MHKLVLMPINNKSLQPLGRKLSIIGKDYLQALNTRLNHLDIDRNYYALLLIENAEGTITQQELAGQLEIDKVSMLRSIDYLSEKGYVKRVKSISDKRKYGLELTEKAHKAIPEIKKAYSDVNAIALKGLNHAEIAAFNSLLQSIKNNINEYSASL